MGKCIDSQVHGSIWRVMNFPTGHLTGTLALFADGPFLFHISNFHLLLGKAEIMDRIKPLDLRTYKLKQE